MIAIIDYGMGNIHSVNKAIQLCKAKALVTDKPGDIKAADKAILPGVGAFDDAMAELKKQGLIDALAAFIKEGKPLLGICLGMQLLFEESEEAAKEKGLGFLQGKVRKFEEKKSLKIPHMGWNQINRMPPDCLLFKDIPAGSFVYFCHSYYPLPKDAQVMAATTDYGGDFTSAVCRDNVYGVQFHPEKSQKVGLKIVENFVNLC